MLWWTLQQLKSSKPEVRARAARSLGAAKNQRAVPSLIRTVEDENAQVRMAAIEALGFIGHPASAEPLVSALANPVKTVNPPRSGSDSGVESAHYKALANALARVGPPAVSPLLGLLRSNEKEPRRWAAYTLGLLKDSRAVDPLIERLDDSRSEVRKTAARALGEIGDVRAVQALIRTLANRDWETRRAAAEALGFIGSEGAVSALAKVAEDQSEPVQIAAVGALGKIGGLPGAASLRLAATSERKAVREAAKSALKSIKFSPAGPEDRAEAAVLTGDFAAALREGAAAAPALIRALQTKDPLLRRQAAEALAELRSEQAAQPLLQALRDHDPAVQEAAARALASIGPPALEGLLKSLTHYDAAVQRLAARVLGETKDARATRALADLIADNRRVSNEYPELLEAVRAAADALAAILVQSVTDIDKRDLEVIAGLPEAAHLLDDRERAVDCAPIRELAQKEILRRGNQ